MTTSIDQLTPHDPTRLIIDPNDPAQHTATRLTDAITALTRGVAEYVWEQNPTVGPGGRQVRFVKSFEAFADPNDTVEDASSTGGYPRFVCWTEAEGTYDPTGLQRKVVSKDQVAPGKYLVSGDEIDIELYAEAWATDPTERTILTGMLEDLFQPVEWMAGFRLELPHYFNQRATYLPKKVKYFDDDLAATRGHRVSRITLSARVPVCTVVTLPLARVRPQVTAQTDPIAPAPGAGRVIGQSVNR